MILVGGERNDPRLHDDDDDDDDLVVALHGEWRLRVVNLVVGRPQVTFIWNFYHFGTGTFLEVLLVTSEEVVEVCLCASLRNDMSH